MNLDQLSFHIWKKSITPATNNDDFAAKHYLREYPAHNFLTFTVHQYMILQPDIESFRAIGGTLRVISEDSLVTQSVY